MKTIKLVLDIMSPADESMVDLAEILNKINGISRVDIVLQELEKNVVDFKVTLDGYDLDYEKVSEALKDFGAVIRNVDSITSAGQNNPIRDNDKLAASLLVLAKHFDSKISEIDQIYKEFDETLKYIRSK